MSISVLLLVLVSGGLMYAKNSLFMVSNLIEDEVVVPAHSVSGIRSIVVVESKRPLKIVNSLEQALSEGLIELENHEDSGFKSNPKNKTTNKRPSMQVNTVSQGIHKSSGAQQQNSLPSLVIYEDELIIEFPKKVASSKNIKQAIVRVLLSKAPYREQNLLSDERFNFKETPYFYKKIADENNHPIRYPKQAYRYANFLLANMAENFSDEEGDFVLLHIPLIQSDLTGPARDYQSWVENYAKKYDIKPSLVYAIMETESGFNAKAVSKSNAIGLMQLKASSAGKDVYNLVDEKSGQPSPTELLNSENNIRMGTAYLSLLTNDYLSEVENKKIKEMMTISSYNGGLSTVLSLFGKTPEKAVSKVNSMNPKQVYKKLRFDHKSAETRAYLDKVLKADTKYTDLLNIPMEAHSKY